MAFLDLSLPLPARRERSLFAFAQRAASLYRQRAALRRLDDAALRDIGLSRTQAATEANRPIWDVPSNWRD